MPESLLAEFPPVPTEAWEEAIRMDLKGADYEKKLVWRTDEGIAVRPYYRAADLPVNPPRLTMRPWTSAQDFQPSAEAVRADEIHERGGHAVLELAYALAQGSKRIAAGARRIEFVFAAGPAYFVEIAKFRAARLLWAEEACRIWIAARTPRRNKSMYDRHTNLLRVTTEAMAAVIGGCDSLTIEPYGFEPHLAENVHRILREEARLDAVADAAAGSYLIEVLTAALAREARKTCAQIEADPEALERALAENRIMLERAMASRRRTLVGVNNFPNLEETGPGGAEGTYEFRLAAPFETIRQRTDRHERVPEVLLLKRGDLKMRMARANFCLNFFGCAGFRMTEDQEYAGTSADLIVLCSSDAEYLPFAREVCATVSAPVIVAGYPKDQIGALQAAGVQGFVHIHSDALETLAYWQDRLGMKR